MISLMDSIKVFNPSIGVFLTKNNLNVIEINSDFDDISHKIKLSHSLIKKINENNAKLEDIYKKMQNNKESNLKIREENNKNILALCDQNNKNLKNLNQNIEVIRLVILNSNIDNGDASFKFNSQLESIKCSFSKGLQTFSAVQHKIRIFQSSNLKRLIVSISPDKTFTNEELNEIVDKGTDVFLLGIRENAVRKCFRKSEYKPSEQDIRYRV